MRLEQHLIAEKAMGAAALRKLVPYNDLTNNERKLWEKVWPMIIKDCKPFLTMLRKQSGATHELMYRNMEDRNEAGSRRVRKHRNPRDTAKTTHQIFDDVLEDIYGYRARSETIFTSGDVNWGSSYGNPYMVFPKGKFKFLWSEDIRDSYDKVSPVAIRKTMYYQYEKDTKALYKSKYGVGKRGAWVVINKNFKPSNKIKTEDDAIKVAVKYFTEEDILTFGHVPANELEKGIRGIIDWYPTTSYDDWVYSFDDKIKLNDYEDDAEKNLVKQSLEYNILEKIDYKEDNLIKALSTRHEIMVKCDEFYYLQTYQYEGLVRQALFGVFT